VVSRYAEVSRAVPFE